MGLTRPRAHQLQDSDFKQSVRAISTSNITLSGGAPSTVDGVSLALNDRVLVTGQSTGSQNGIYYVTTVGSGSNGTWARSPDADATGDMTAGMVVMVTEGTSYADTSWKITTNDPITLDTTSITFEQSSAYGYGTIAVSGQSSIVADSVGDTLTVTAGNNISLTTNASTDTLTVAVADSISASGTITATGNITGGNITTAGIGTFTGLTVDTNTLFVDSTNNRIGIGTTSPAYQVEIENTGNNALLVLDRTDGAACFIEGQATRSAFGSVGATPLALAYNSFAVVTIGANGAITVNPDGDGFTFPTTDGSANQFLQTDGAGAITFASATVSDISDLTATAAELNKLDGVTATTAELNKLDGVTATTTELNYVDGVTSAIQTQLDTKITASSTDTLTNKTLTSPVVGTDIRLNAQAELEFYDSDSSNYVSFRAPATITSNITWTLPASDGTADQVLATDGAGTLSWADPGSGGGSGSSYPNSTFQTLPGTNGNFDLSYNVAQTSQEIAFEAGGTDAFGVNLGSVFSLMDPIGSIETAAETGLDLGVLT